jgi:hypothetical protein
MLVLDAGDAVGQTATAKLKPTALEVLKELHVVLSKSKGKPLLGIQVDSECVDRVRFLLKEMDFLVTYYPPPSPEETVLNDATNPNLR